MRIARPALFALALILAASAGCGRRSSESVSAPGRCLASDATWEYTVIFAASPTRVREIFGGWREPVAPHPRVGRNPFTGKEISIQTTAPADTVPGPAAGAWKLRPSDEPGGAGYDRYLESRVPPEVRAVPHRTLKGAYLAMMDLSQGLTNHDALPVALYPPSGCTTAQPLFGVSGAVVAGLRTMKDDEASTLAARLASDESIAEWTAAEYSELLRDLRELTAGSASDEIYLLAV